MFIGFKNMPLQQKAEALHSGVKVVAGLGIGGAFAAWYSKYEAMITFGLGVGTIIIVLVGTVASIYFRCQENSRKKVEHLARMKTYNTNNSQ